MGKKEDLLKSVSLQRATANLPETMVAVGKFPRELANRAQRGSCLNSNYLKQETAEVQQQIGPEQLLPLGRVEFLAPRVGFLIEII